MVFLGEKLIHKSMWESSMRLGWISHVNILLKFLSKDMDVSQMIFTWVSNDFFHPNSFQRTFKRTKECWKDFDQNMNVKHYIQFSSTWHVNSIWCWKNYIQDISAGNRILKVPSVGGLFLLLDMFQVWSALHRPMVPFWQWIFW